MRSPCTLAVAALLVLSAAVAGEPAGTEAAAPAPATSAQPAGKFQPKGPLAALPSGAEGPHIGKIRALADDQWLNLGQPAADPVWGQRRGARWTPRMAYAAELRAAFVTGAGAHDVAHTRNGELHFDDDIFAYDINAHRWVCVYPGANCKALKLRLDDRGMEVDEQGKGVPVAFAAHGYNTYTYDPDGHRFVCMPCMGFGRTPIPQRAEWLGSDPKNPLGKLNRSPKHPVIYDLGAGRLERRYVDGTGPGPKYFEGLAEYIPSRKQVFYLYRSEVWFYDLAGNRWTEARAPKWIDPKTGKEVAATGYDCTACLDTKRERVYTSEGEHFLYYDVKGKAWSSPKDFRPPVTLGGGRGETMTYDSVNDVIVLNVYDKGDIRGGEKKGLFGAF